MQKVRVIYTGRVQGVGFRMTVREIAKKHKVHGSVCNVANGSVELLAVGSGSSLMKFLEAIDQSMSRFIEGCTVDWLDGAEGEFEDFSIAPDKWGE